MSKVSTRVVALATVVGSVLAAASTASAALNLPTQSCNYVFTANLKAGMRNAEVRNLQKVLNAYPQTMVAASGAGSTGMETDYFGAATKAAVIKFQSINGVTPTSGNVFSLTRAVLNQVCNGSTPTTPTTPSTSGNVSVMLSANQPTNVLVAGQAAARLADFVFTGNGTVTNVTLARTGVSANDTLTNVYLYDGANRLTDSSSVNTQGVITFNMPAGGFTVNGSRTITVRADILAGVSGQSVGVNLTGYNVMGGSMASVNVMGTQLPVANVSLASVNLQSQTVTTNPSLNLPQSNYTVWGSSVNVSTRTVVLKNLTLKMIGSAPVNSVANVQLYVDGVSVGTATADANQRFVFTPNLNLTTGSHTVEVRSDVVAGASRNFYFTLENVADFLAEDSQVTGANITLGTSGYTSYRQAGLQTINSTSGTSVTVNQDTTFSVTNLVSGATNQAIAKYKLIAYGEDTKIQYISVTPTVSGGSNLTNVALYVNGAQVGSNYTITSGGTQQYSLGSNFIATAGQAYTVEVRADLINSAGANATGTVSATINNLSGIGQSSQNSFGPISPSLTVKTLTIGGGNPVFGKTIGGVSTTVSSNSSVKIASFSIQGGSTEAINIRTLVLGLSGTVPLTSISNITLVDANGNQLANATGIAAASQTYTVNIPVATGATKRVDVMATIGAATNGQTIVPTLTTTYIGASSNQASTTGAIAGDTLTIASIVVGTPTVSSKIAAQYVLGNTGKQVIVYNATSSNGTATINDLTFTVTGSGVQSLTINGSTAQVIGTTATFTGINLAVPAGASGVNVPVVVNMTPVYISSGSGVVTGTTNSIALTSAKITDASSNVTTPTYSGLASNSMTLVATLAYVNAIPNSGINLGVSGATTTGAKLGSVTVKADQSGDIVVGRLSYNLNAPGAVANVVVKVAGSTALDIAGVASTNTTSQANFAAGYRITAGNTVTFDIYGDVGPVTTSGNTSVALGTDSNFLWSDNPGTAGTNLTGTLLGSNYNK